MSVSAVPNPEKALERVLHAHGLICGALISETGTVSRVGDYSELAEPHLASALLGPRGTAKDTFASLEGQLRPTIWGQGNVFAFIDRCGAGLAIVVFGQGSMDAIEQYHLSQEVGQTIAREFSSAREIA